MPCCWSRHLLPNALPPIFVVMAVDLAVAIMLEATLSFLGVGVPLTEPSLGMMIAIGKKLCIRGNVVDGSFPRLGPHPAGGGHQPFRRLAAGRTQSQDRSGEVTGRWGDLSRGVFLKNSCSGCNPSETKLGLKKG